MPLLAVETLAANAAYALVALALGIPVLRGVEALAGASPRPPSLTRLGAALLAGFGGCAIAGIVLGAAHLFRWQVFAVAGAVAVFLSRACLLAYARSGAAFLRRVPTAGPVVLLATAVALVVGITQWLDALAPSEAFDELWYHLPEARTLADSHALHLTLGHDPIYGNLPTLMETLYGEALTIRGVPLAHAVHLSVFASFVLLAVGIVRSLWGARAAAFAAAGIALYSPLLYNATTAYVDSAATAFEVGAVLLLVLWSVRREPGDAGAAALLLGLALAVKYTALVTALLAAAVVGAHAFRARDRRLPAAFAAIAVLACGYWYGKNLVRFGNPIYPLAFGHPGISDTTYSTFLASVHAFGPRTVTAFLEIPTRFADDGNVTAFFGFVLSPLALFARGPWRASALLLGYAAVYTTYWFWLGSHQTRFLMSAVVVAIVLGAVAIGAARAPVWLAVAAVLAFASVVVVHARMNDFGRNVGGAVSAWLDVPKAKYVLGLETRDAYFREYFGCQVDAVNLLAARHLDGAVGIWAGDPAPGYSKRNVLVPMVVTATTTAGVRAQLRNLGVRFALAQGQPVAQLIPGRTPAPILAAARPFWHEQDCTLYRLDLAG